MEEINITFIFFASDFNLCITIADANKKHRHANMLEAPQQQMRLPGNETRMAFVKCLND